MRAGGTGNTRGNAVHGCGGGRGQRQRREEHNKLCAVVAAAAAVCRVRTGGESAGEAVGAPKRVVRHTSESPHFHNWLNRLKAATTAWKPCCGPRSSREGPSSASPTPPKFEAVGGGGGGGGVAPSVPASSPPPAGPGPNNLATISYTHNGGSCLLPQVPRAKWSVSSSRSTKKASWAPRHHGRGRSRRRSSASAVVSCCRDTWHTRRRPTPPPPLHLTFPGILPGTEP